MLRQSCTVTTSLTGPHGTLRTKVHCTAANGDTEGAAKAMRCSFLLSCQHSVQLRDILNVDISQYFVSTSVFESIHKSLSIICRVGLLVITLASYSGLPRFETRFEHLLSSLNIFFTYICVNGWNSE